MRLAIEILVFDAILLQSYANNPQQAGELRKDQRLVAFVEDRTQLLDKNAELCALGFDQIAVHQPGMAGCLAQAQQCFEHHDL